MYVCIRAYIYTYCIYFVEWGRNSDQKWKGTKYTLNWKAESTHTCYITFCLYHDSVIPYGSRFFVFFFCFVFSFVLLMCVCVCVCVLCSRFVELIENSHFAFSCWMREKFLTIDAISFLCSHFKPKAKVWWKWATERLAHERERGPWKKKTKTEQFFPPVFFPRCPDLL